MSDTPGHDEQRYRRPDWMGAPDNYLPALVPVEVTIGRGRSSVVHMSCIRAYPAGWSFVVDSIVEHEDESLEEDPYYMMHRRLMGGMSADDPLPDSLMRFIFEFPDGSRARSMELGLFEGPRRGAPSAPVLLPGGGSGGGGTWQQQYWCWPIPPAGTIRIMCEWPAQGIELTFTELDASLVRDASTKAEQLWDDLPEPPDDGAMVTAS